MIVAEVTASVWGVGAPWDGFRWPPRPGLESESAPPWCGQLVRGRRAFSERSAQATGACARPVSAAVGGAGAGHPETGGTRVLGA